MYYDSLTKYMGFSLVVVAFMRSLDFVVFTSTSLIGYAVSALFFAVIDLINFKVDEGDDPFRFNKTKKLLYLLAALSFTTLPYINISWSIEYISKINDTSVLIGVGTILIISGFKSEKGVSDKVERLIEKLVSERIQAELPRVIEEAISPETITRMTLEAIEEREKEKQQVGTF
ncbi:hypothetical protein [Brevibacillus gelatini]